MRIKYWSPEALEMVVSRHDYTEFTVEIPQPYEEPISHSLFEDTETGIVVGDVGKFEAWLETVQTTPVNEIQGENLERSE